MGQCACKQGGSPGKKKKSFGKLSKTQLMDLLNTTKFTGTSSTWHSSVAREYLFITFSLFFFLATFGYPEEEIYEWHAAFKKAFPNGRITYDLYQEIVLKAVFRRHNPENVDDMGAQVGNSAIHSNQLTKLLRPLRTIKFSF